MASLRPSTGLDCSTGFTLHGKLVDALFSFRMSSVTQLAPADLTTIRQNTDWRRLFEVLSIEQDSKKSREHDWWGKSPLSPAEQTASFHINDQGWYCHSTGRGGGALELIMALHPEMNCYDAGRFLLDKGVSSIVGETRNGVERTTPEEPPDQNLPIRQDLRSQLDPRHPDFEARDIPPGTLTELGAGYLERPPRKNGRRDPMNHRLVFQIRGLQEDERGTLHSAVLGHIGRATSTEQEQSDGKWWTYAGFRKSLELYNLDLALLDDEALDQAAKSNHVVIVEGGFDVAKLMAAGIRNAVATFGCHLSTHQAGKLDLIAEMTGVRQFLLFYDRDQDGSSPNRQGAINAAEQITARGFEVEIFDWNRRFSSSTRTDVRIPDHIGDPCDFSLTQLQWLRAENWI